MTKKDTKELKAAIESWLQLKELTGSQEKQMDALKETILQTVARYPDEWVGGVFEVAGVGHLKEMNNPPRLALTATGLPLTDIETVGLLAELGETYRKPAINVAQLRGRVIRRDLPVLAVLAKHGVVCESTKRIEIKAK